MFPKTEKGYFSHDSSLIKYEFDGKIFKRYHPNGKLFQQMELTKNHLNHGEFFEYGYNGKLRQRCIFKNGFVYGKFEGFYNEKLWKCCFYKERDAQFGERVEYPPYYNVPAQFFGIIEF